MAKFKILDYQLPKNLISQKPIKPRDNAKLIVLDRKHKKIYHQIFYELDKFLKRGDILVFNNTKVIPARLIGNLKNNKKIEVLLLENLNKKLDWSKTWYVLIKGKIKENQTIYFKKNLSAKIIKNLGYKKIIEFNQNKEKLKNTINKIGITPTPPYIKTLNKLKDYQTIYAKKEGSIAAPTAGLHFTKRLLNKLKRKGIIFQYITLNIGLGTFLPIKEKNIKHHQMESELAIIDKKTANFLNSAKKKKQRIIAVGTTTTRALEGMIKNSKLQDGEKFIDLFIYPPFKFKIINGLITNFHLPKSTPLLLTSAFAGEEFLLSAYQQAIEKKYRFYSFGDAMLIL